MKPLNDYSFIRGVCYGGWDKDENEIRRDLGYGKRVGLNSVRFWISPYEFEKSGEAYLQKVQRFVRICFECGYTSMPILYNGNGIPCEENPRYFSEEFLPVHDAYMDKAVELLKDEPGLLVWDVMNEPEVSYFVRNCEDPAEKERRLGVTRAFERRMVTRLRQLDPDNAITVGHALADELGATADLVDVISFHNYERIYKDIRRDYETAKAMSERYGKPFMNTETGCLARANPYDMVLQLCNEYGIGWYLFELMIHDRCQHEHGIFYPDGTVRDPATIAAMYGCYRKRDGEGLVRPLPNQEGVAAGCVDRIKAALTEYTCDCFDYRRSDLTKLLDTCEEAANLLECCDLVPMACPPTYRINAWRKQENPDLDEIRAFAYDLAKTLREICQLL